MEEKELEAMSLSDRFVVKERDRKNGLGEIEIIVDTLTGVNYLHILGQITPLLGSDGTPVVDG